MIRVRKFNICTDLRLQIWITSLVCVFIQKEQKRIQIAVIGTINTAAKIQIECILIIELIRYICGRKCIDI